MELGPIGGFPPLAASELQSSDIELPAVAKIDSSARPGKYSSSRRQSAGRQEADSAAPAPQDAAVEPAVPDPDEDPGSQISFFA